MSYFYRATWTFSDGKPGLSLFSLDFLTTDYKLLRDSMIERPDLAQYDFIFTTVHPITKRTIQISPRGVFET